MEEAICEDEPPDVRPFQSDVSDWLGATVLSRCSRGKHTTRPTADKSREEPRKTRERAARTGTDSEEAPVRYRPVETKPTKHLDLGMVYAQQGRTDEAIREFQAALRINPNVAEAHYSLGVIYMQQGRMDEAIREYQAALRINPIYADAHFNLGAIYGSRAAPMRRSASTRQRCGSPRPH